MTDYSCNGKCKTHEGRNHQVKARKEDVEELNYQDELNKKEDENNKYDF